MIRVRAFLDANVLAKPFSRSLLLIGAAANGGFEPVWSRHAELEGNSVLVRRLPDAMRLEVLREINAIELSPTGENAQSFIATDPKDRQILADAVAAECSIIVTENVADFAEKDLDATGLTAVHHDLFAATFLSDDGYLGALQVLRHGKPVEEVHQRVSVVHPLVFRRFRHLFPLVRALPPAKNQPKILYKGRAWFAVAPLLTIDQVAVRLSMAAKTVMRLIDDDSLTAFYLDGRWQIPIAEFKRFREARSGEMISMLSQELETDLYE